MLLDKEVKLSTKYNYDLDYYENLGYDVSGSDFIVKVEHLLKKSFVKVNVRCEYCNTHEIIPYYNWNRSMNSAIKKYCCKSCKGSKIKESNLLKYGVTSVAKLESSKEKSKITNKRKRGVEFHTQSEEVKRKIKKSNLNKLRVENPMQSDVIKKKQKNTVFRNYGVENISKLEKIKNKKRKTMISNFGVDSPLRSDKIKEKVKITNLKKFGNEFFTKNENYRKENYIIANDNFYLNYIADGLSKFKCDSDLNHNFEISKDVYSKRKLYNIGLCTVCNPILSNRSVKEKELFNFISNLYNGEIVNNYRDGKMEIDIYLPKFNMGFEFNGLYWHSNIYKDSKFHLKKLSYFKEKEIRLINIWEDDWTFKRNIIESQIKNLFNLNKRIFARDCYIKEISTKVCKEFLNKNHIQGSVNSLVKIGLYKNDEMVCVMTFDHFEGRKKMKNNEWNLSRFCNSLNTNVIGGASKLLSYFVKNYDVKRVVSYADKDWSLGYLYNKLGFSLISESKPDYKYIIEGKRVNKSRFRKSRTNLSESKILIPKIWDCGKIKFEKLF
jgi:hypothetical protein